MWRDQENRLHPWVLSARVEAVGWYLASWKAFRLNIHRVPVGHQLVGEALGSCPKQDAWDQGLFFSSCSGWKSFSRLSFVPASVHLGKWKVV